MNDPYVTIICINGVTFILEKMVTALECGSNGKRYTEVSFDNGSTIGIPDCDMDLFVKLVREQYEAGEAG
jgi:hypothetical protein